MQVHEYLEIVQKQIRQEQLHEEIKQELLGHIEEQADYFQSRGISREEAAEKAVEEMGDPVEIGVALDEVHRPRMDVMLFLLLFLVSAAVGVIHLLWADELTGIANRYNVFIWSGCAMVMILSQCAGKFKMDTQKQMHQFIYIFMIAGIILTMVFTKCGTMSAEILAGKDAYRGYLNGCVTGFSLLMFRYRGCGEKGLRSMAALGALPCILSVMERSYFYTLLLILAHGTLLSLGICRGWYQVPKKKTLYRIWVIPVIMSLGAVFLIGRSWASGGISAHIKSYLEAPDIPGVLLARFGMPGLWGVAVWALLMAFAAWRMIQDTRKLTNEYCHMVCLGVLLALGVQMVYSLLGVLGLGVEGGIYFPFFSPARNIYGVQTYIEFIMLSLFLYHGKYDRALPKKIMHQTYTPRY